MDWKRRASLYFVPTFMFSLVLIYKKKHLVVSTDICNQQSITFLYLILLCMLMRTDAGAMAGWENVVSRFFRLSTHRELCQCLLCVDLWLPQTFNVRSVSDCLVRVATGLENLEKLGNGKSRGKCVLACGQLPWVLFLMQEGSSLLGKVVHIEPSCHSYERYESIAVFLFVSLMLQGSIISKYSLEMSGTDRDFMTGRVAILFVLLIFSCLCEMDMFYWR